jgi:hypothetical protein
MTKDYQDAADAYVNGSIPEVIEWLHSRSTSKISVLLFVDQLVVLGSKAYPESLRSEGMDHLEAINKTIDLLIY